MRFELEILDGINKGKTISIHNGLVLGRSGLNFSFADQMFAESHAKVFLDYKNSWNIESLDRYLIRIGSSEVTKISLLPGLIFHLGQTGFKFIEKKATLSTNWTLALQDWLKKNPGNKENTDLFFFLNPIRLTFIQGPQFGDFLTLAYGPRLLGYNCLDLNLIDPLLPREVVRFLQIGEQTYIENLCGNKALINSNSFEHHPIQEGDVLKIGSTLIELSILK